MGRTIGQAKVGSEGAFAGFSSARGGRGTLGGPCWDPWLGTTARPLGPGRRVRSFGGEVCSGHRLEVRHWFLGPVMFSRHAGGGTGQGPGPWVLWASFGARRLPGELGPWALGWGWDQCCETPQQPSPAVLEQHPPHQSHCGCWRRASRAMAGTGRVPA